jgi:pimeloyl-ACP methyl ester carboxylesterase
MHPGLRLVRLALMLAACAAAHGETIHWTATLEFGPVKFRLALHLISGPDGHPSAMVDSIDQSAFDLQAVRLRVSGRELRFQVPRLRGRFTGTFSADGSAIEGVWTERRGALPVHFRRGSIRPQEPSPPFPYTSEEVVCRNGHLRLAGTLTVPRAGGPHPAVVLIAGSGPQDRNGSSSGHRPFLVWADFLTRRGFAVLRLDDRGVGGSTGSLLDSTDEDFAGDELAAVDLLKGRREIDPRRIGLLGHSEGAAVATLAGARSRDIAFLVLLAGSAIPGERVLYAQAERISRAMGIPEDVVKKNLEVQAKLFAIARTASGGAEARKRMRTILASETSQLDPASAAVVRGQAGGQIATAASRWFRFVLDYDPAPALGRVECPVLALYGSLDLQVPADLNEPAMEAALARNRYRRVVTIPGLNHLLQNAATGSPLEYAQIEETVAPQALEVVGGWLATIPGSR